jgi:hypothetical protein
MYSRQDYELIQPVLAEISKYPALDLIHLCINEIWRTERYRPKYPRESMPWVLLWLIKLTLIYGDQSETDQLAKARDSVGGPSLPQVCNKLLAVWNHCDADRVEERIDAKDWFFYFRKKAFGQFPFMFSFSISSLARQSLMFAGLDQHDRLSFDFSNAVGITVEHFIELQFPLLRPFYGQTAQWERPISITEDLFTSWAPGYPPGTIPLFLKTLSKDFHGIRAFFESQRRTHAPELCYEYTEMSPLKRFPLLRVGNEYHCYSPVLLYRCVEDFIYDVLREKAPQAFGHHFGTRIFEPYVDRAISYSGLPKITEAQIMEQVAGSGKVVDFIVVDNDINIFIDAKGVEATYIGEVSEDPAHIVQRARTSAIYGIEQAYNLVSRVDGVQQIADVPLGQSNERYLLIVTYKDLVLGSGKMFYEYIAKQEIDEIIQRTGGDQLIPLEHIYFVSIEDFDLFMHSIHTCQTGMVEFLRRVVDIDRTIHPLESKLLFRQHLHDILHHLDVPRYLYDEVNQIRRRVGNRLPRRGGN